MSLLRHHTPLQSHLLLQTSRFQRFWRNRYCGFWGTKSACSTRHESMSYKNAHRGSSANAAAWASADEPAAADGRGVDIFLFAFV